jgi:hypothetical protein
LWSHFTSYLLLSLSGVIFKIFNNWLSKYWPSQSWLWHQRCHVLEAVCEKVPEVLEEEGMDGLTGVVTGPIYQMACKYLNILVSTGHTGAHRLLTVTLSHCSAMFC